MRYGGLLIPAFLCGSAISACNGDRVAAPDGAGDGAALVVASPNGAVAVTAATPFRYDATKGGVTFTL